MKIMIRVYDAYTNDTVFQDWVDDSNDIDLVMGRVREKVADQFGEGHNG